MAKLFLSELVLKPKMTSIALSGLFRLNRSPKFIQKCQYSQGTLKDNIDKYFDPTIQNLLKELTEVNYNKVFRNRKVGNKLKDPKYSFMTEEQLEKSIAEAREKADKLLQMPPVCRTRQPIDKVLSFDPYLQGYDDFTYIFTDITLDISDRNRLIVARDPDGTLRHASWEERDKMNSIYFPTQGREFHTPAIFTDFSKLQQILDKVSPEENTYELVLDRACIQFEPDDPLYISTTETVYQTVDERRHYDSLKSTRHYGPMLFFLARTRNMDNLIQFNILEKRISNDVIPLLKLFHKLFPESKSAAQNDKPQDSLEIIRKYIQFDSLKKSELELVFNAYVESDKNQKDYEDGLNRAHGLS